MKTRLVTLLIVCATFQLSIGHNNSPLSFENFRTGSGKNIQIVGEASIVFTESLFSNFEKKNKLQLPILPKEIKKKKPEKYPKRKKNPKKQKKNTSQKKKPEQHKPKTQSRSLNTLPATSQKKNKLPD